MFGVRRKATSSFVENALAKARHASAATGLAKSPTTPACASGARRRAEVISARFAGRTQIRRAQQRPAAGSARPILPEPAQRRALFYSAVVLVRHAEDPRTAIADGGEMAIARSSPPRGEGSFGYDPLFWVPELEQTAAELDSALKNTSATAAPRMRHLLDRPRRAPFEWCSAAATERIPP